MTHHNIAGSEAFAPPRHVLVRVGRRRRKMHPALQAYGGALAIGLGTGVLDVAIDAPVMLPVALAALVVWRFWPTPR